MKFSSKFERDYEWFSSVAHRFNFDGVNEYCNKMGENLIQYDPNGLTAKECFYLYDTQGKIKPTREAEKLRSILKTKGSVNLYIKMYAEDRAKGYLPKVEFDEICKQINALDWFIEAVEKQKYKYYEV